MKKVNIFSLLLIILLFKTSCGYTPIYSSSNFELKIKKIDYEPNILNKQIVQTLSSLSNPSASKEYNLSVNTLNEKNIVSKNSKGETVIFEKKIVLELELYNEENRYNKKFSSKINYNNNDNKFELKQFEKIIINDLVDKIIRRINLDLSSIK